MSMSMFKNETAKLNVIWNIYVFVSEALQHGFETQVPEEGLRVEDRWILSRLNSLKLEVSRHMEEYELHKAFNSLIDFYIEDLSHLYIKVIRDRIWNGDEDDRRRCLSVLYKVSWEALKMLAPFLPFISEEIYIASLRMEGMPESIHLYPWPEVEENLVNKDLEVKVNVMRQVVAAISNLRSNIGIKLRQPVKDVALLSRNDQFIQALKDLKDVFLKLSNAKDLRILSSNKELGEGYAGLELEKAKVYINTKLGFEELSEGLAREVVRRIQLIRRKLGLKRGREQVDVWIVADKSIREMINPKADYVKRIVQASSLSFVQSGDMVPSSAVNSKFNFQGNEIQIYVSVKG